MMRIRRNAMKVTGASSRKPTNISLDTDLVRDARSLGVNLSRACEEGLVARIAQERARRWQVDNAEAIASSNAYVEREGLPLDQYRQF
jgi:antitoxin CcdA